MIDDKTGLPEVPENYRWVVRKDLGMAAFDWTAVVLQRRVWGLWWTVGKDHGYAYGVHSIRNMAARIMGRRGNREAKRARRAAQVAFARRFDGVYPPQQLGG